MNPVSFPEANAVYGPPPELNESQCQRIPAFQGVVRGGNLDGSEFVVVAWQPTDEELGALLAGGPIYISMLGRLCPHFLTTSFEGASHAA